MTVSSDVSGTLGSVTWSDEQLYLKEFVHKVALPTVVRIVKGQYCNLGLSSISNPSLQSTLLITNFGPRKRILAQSIKFKDKRVAPAGPKLAIPNTFDGFFELLSEDGRSVRCIESVAELSRRFPDAVLVRENIRAFVSKSDDVDMIEDQSRMVEVGETLLLVGEVMGVKSRGVRPARFLRCFDKNGENVYLPFELKGKFSAIAKEDNISGVHTPENLTSKRLPVMARLVHGLPPVGLKSSQSFLPELRLFNVIEEDYLVAMTLGSSMAVVPLPLPANVKLQYATNMNLINSTKEFNRLKERCLELGTHLEDRIVVHDIATAKDLRLNGADLKQKIKPPINATTPGSHRYYTQGYQPTDEYDELEQIYDYVRGFAPLPKTARGWRYEPSSPTKLINNTSSGNNAPHSTDESTGSSNHTSDLTPPEPPPLETLPSRMKLIPPDMHSAVTIFTPPPWAYGPLKNDVYEVVPTAPPPQNNINNNKPTGEAKKRQRHSAEKSSSSNSPMKQQQQHHLLHPNAATIEAAAAAAAAAAAIASADPNLGGGQQQQNSLSTSNPISRENNNNNNSSTTPRFIKSANYRSSQGSSVNYRQRFFRSNRSPVPVISSNNASSCPKEIPREIYTPNGGSGNNPNNLGFGGGDRGGGLSVSGPSMFQMRYKSMTNLASHTGPGEYDTLNSSNSGGKTSGGSSSNRHPETKRSRKLSRPKSMTNLFWGQKERSASRQSLNNAPAELTLDPNPKTGQSNYRHHHSRDFSSPAHHAAVFANGKKLGSSKKIGTLYL